MFTDSLDYLHDTLFLSLVTIHGALAQTLRPVWWGIVTLVILVIYLLGVFTKFTIPIRDLIWYGLKVAFASLLIFEWSTYTDFLLALYIDVPNALTSDVVSAFTGGSSDSVNDQLDNVWDKGMASAARVLDIAGFRNPAAYLIATIVAVATALFVIISSGIIVISQSAVFLLLCIGPAFVLMWLVGWTSRAFALWNGQCFNYAVLGVMVYIGLMLFGVMVEKAVLQVDDMTVRDALTFTDASSLVFLAGLIFVLIKRLPSITTAIAAGISLDYAAGGSIDRAKAYAGQKWARLKANRNALKVERKKAAIWAAARSKK